MNIKASGRSALIVATGLFVCIAGPSHATASADGAAAGSKSQSTAPMALNKYAKHAPHHWKSYAHRKSGKLALKPSAAGKAVATDVATADGDDLPTIPPSVANANAQMADADTPTSNAAKAMTARANDILQAAPAGAPPASDNQVVSADQLNDIDRALPEGKPMTMASAEASAPPAPAAPAAASNNSSESSTWDQTSLIGKIFIGFGALLTMASAARMFMA
jgi:hypothetical protein